MENPVQIHFLVYISFLQLLHGWRSPSGITQGRAVRPPAFSGEGLVLGRERGAGCLFKCALQCDGGRPAGRAIPPCGRSPPAAIARPVPMVTRLPPALGPPCRRGSYSQRRRRCWPGRAARARGCDSPAGAAAPQSVDNSLPARPLPSRMESGSPAGGAQRVRLQERGPAAPAAA